MDKQTYISFKVDGKPIQKGSFKTFVTKPSVCRKCNSGKHLRAIVVNDNKHTKRYQKQISTEFTKTISPKFNICKGAVKLTITFFFKKPKSCPKDRYYPEIRPDIDKLSRTVLDALTGVLYVDDSQVVSLSANKRYGQKECVLIIAENLTKIEDIQQEIKL